MHVFELLGFQTRERLETETQKSSPHFALIAIHYCYFQLAVTLEGSVQDSLEGVGCAQFICDHTRPEKNGLLCLFSGIELK